MHPLSSLQKLKPYPIFSLIILACCYWILSTKTALSFNNKTLNLLSKDKKIFAFGIGLGPSYHRLSIDKTPEFLTQKHILSVVPLAIPGFSTQSFSYINLGKHWQLRSIAIVPFFNFSQYNLEIKERKSPNEITKRSRVLESFKLGIPFDFIFRSDRITNFRFYTLGGIYQYYNFFTTGDETIKQDDILVNINQIDWGLNIGIGCDFYASYNIISFEIKYNLGLKNLFVNDKASLVANTIQKLYTRDIYFYIIIH